MTPETPTRPPRFARQPIPGALLQRLLYKRLHVPLHLTYGVLRGAKIAGNPRRFRADHLAAAPVIKGLAEKSRIPETKGYRLVEPGSLPGLDGVVARCQELGRKARIPDDCVERVLGLDAATKLVGPAGSSAFVDSARCLHYGSRGNRRDRLLLSIQFLRFQADPLQRLARGWA